MGLGQVPMRRDGVYDLYWIFAARRQEAFERRLAGLPRPWSEDRIIQEFKFCNVYRAADRVSQYLIRTIAYGQDVVSDDDKLFQIVAFRTFSSPQTWDGVVDRLGRSPVFEDLVSGSF